MGSEIFEQEVPGKEQKAWVAVALSDLRRQPGRRKPSYVLDRAQETQLLRGERVRIFAVKKGWLQVEALDQPCYLHGRWQGYPGWIEQEHVQYGMSWPERYLCRRSHGEGPSYQSFGSFSAGRQGESPAHCLWESSWLGTPYHWGGCSAYTPGLDWPLTGLDCSGLVHLVYRAQGLCIPRDAHDQFLWAEAISLDDTAPGDLVFTHPRGKQRVDHVMLDAGLGRLLESTEEVGAVRLVDRTQRIGDLLASGQYSVSAGRVTHGCVLHSALESLEGLIKAKTSPAVPV